MNCPKTTNKIKKTVDATIKLMRRELLSDISNYAFVEGDSMADTEDHRKHLTQDIAEGRNLERVTRVFDAAYSIIQERLYPFTKSEVLKGAVVDNTLESHSEYIFNLTLPDTFSKTTLLAMKELIHEFFICTAISDWLRLINNENFIKWDEKKEPLLKELQKILLHRRSRYKRTQSPF